MKKSKFLKALLALGLGALMTASAFGLAACELEVDPGSGSGNGDEIVDDGDFDLDKIEVAAPKVPKYEGAAPALKEGMSEVSYTVNVGDLPTGNLASEWTNGTFKITSGAEVRDRGSVRVYDGESYQYSLKFGGGTLYLVAPSAGKLTVLVENGSSGAKNAAILFNGVSYEYPISGIQAVEIDVTAAGTYPITRNNSVNGTTDIYYAKFVTELNNTPIE